MNCHGLKQKSLNWSINAICFYKDSNYDIRKIFVALLQDRARKLRIFVDDKHPFADKPLQPYIMPPRNVRELRPRARRASERAQKKAANREAKLALLEQNNPNTALTWRDIILYHIPVNNFRWEFSWCLPLCYSCQKFNICSSQI